MENKENKGSKSAYVYAAITFAIYAVIFIMGMVGYFTNALDNAVGGLGFTSKLPEPLVAYGNTAYANIISMMFIAMTPSVLLYLGAKAPFKMPTALRVVLYIVGTAGLIALAVVYSSVCNEYREITNDLGDTLGLKLSIALGVVGFFVLYLLSILNLDPTQIRFKILRNIIKFCKTDIFCVIVTLLFTILLFPLYVIIAAIVAMILLFTLWAVLYILINKSSSTQPTHSITVDGAKLQLTPSSFVIDRSAETYTDQYGKYWLTKDHGKTFYRGN